MVKQIFIPNSSTSINTLKRTVIGSGVGAVLLDGGVGGQSSYHGIDDYLSTTNKNKFINEHPSGRGLSDKINSRLESLKIDKKPKTKNIRLSF